MSDHDQKARESAPASETTPNPATAEALKWLRSFGLERPGMPATATISSGAMPPGGAGLRAEMKLRLCDEPEERQQEMAQHVAALICAAMNGELTVRGER